MIAYIDASVIIRLVFNEPYPLAEWSQIDEGITSQLTRLECARTFDRHRIRGLRTATIRTATQSADAILSRTYELEVTQHILQWAAKPLSTPLGTLDSIHLASASAYRRALGPPQVIAFATHDRELAEAAKSLGFPVIGTSLP